VPFSIAQHEKSSRTLRAGYAGGLRPSLTIFRLCTLLNSAGTKKRLFQPNKETNFSPPLVMAGLDPAIHAFSFGRSQLNHLDRIVFPNCS
jgi:hypothetical protein